MREMERFTRFWADEVGQDLTEYALLLAFVCLAAAAIFIVSAGNFLGIWSASNTVLSKGNQAAHGGS